MYILRKHILCSFLMALFAISVCSCDDDSRDIVTEELRITEINPTQATSGDNIIIKGSGFGDYRVDVAGHVFFNEVEATDFVKYSKNRIIVKVPEGATSGAISVTVDGNSVSSEQQFTYIEPIDENALRITGFEPMEAYTGSEITIMGANFGNSVNGISVNFNGVEATDIISVNNDEIKVVVPYGATTGKITVKSNTEQSTSTDDFICKTSAQITAITPSQVWAGEEVTLTGENFHDVNAEEVIVNFNGTEVKANSISGNAIKVTVPEDANSGIVSVKFGNIQTVDGPFLQLCKLYQNDFNAADGSSYAPFTDAWAWSPNYIKIIDQNLEFYYNAEARRNDNRRMRRGAEVTCDFSTVTQGWYGFKFYLPKDGFPMDENGIIIAQMFNGGCRNTWAGHLSIDKGELKLSYRHALVTPNELSLGKLETNKWYSVVLHFKVGLDDKGCLEAWIGDDMDKNKPTVSSGPCRFGFGHWISDEILDNRGINIDCINYFSYGGKDAIGCKFGLYVSNEVDITIRFDDIKVLEGNPTNAFDLVRP